MSFEFAEDEIRLLEQQEAEVAAAAARIKKLVRTAPSGWKADITAELQKIQALVKTSVKTARYISQQHVSVVRQVYIGTSKQVLWNNKHGTLSFVGPALKQ
jgi:hypothetical protein